MSEAYKFSPELENKAKKEIWPKDFDAEKAHKLIKSFIYKLKMVGISPDDIEDITQATLLKAMEAFKKPGFDESHPANLNTWLATIAERTAVDLLRRKKFRDQLQPSLDTDRLVSEEPTNREKLIAAETDVLREKNLAFHLDQLPPEQREVIELTAKGLSLEEIAKLKQVSVNTIKSRKRYALDYLSVMLADKDK